MDQKYSLKIFKFSISTTRRKRENMLTYNTDYLVFTKFLHKPQFSFVLIVTFIGAPTQFLKVHFYCKLHLMGKILVNAEKYLKFLYIE